jgi:hypothetical protein
MLDFLDDQLTKEELIKMVDQASVWSAILGFIPKGTFRSPFRSDPKPGCKLDWYDGKLLFVDWSRGVYLDCIEAYKLLNPHKKWYEISRDLRKHILYNKSVQVEREKEFKVKYSEWKTNHKEYWYQRGVTSFQLNRPSTLVRPLKGFEFEKKQVDFFDLCYGYHFEGRVKAYFPQEQPINLKFLGNQKRNDVWHLRRGSKTLLISKAHKDLLVLENLCEFDLTHVQGERLFPTQNKMDMWSIEYDLIYILFDNDPVGIEGANLLCNLLSTETRLIFTPTFKDIDEMAVHNFNQAKECLQTLIY